jgi:hypothetical protein
MLVVQLLLAMIAATLIIGFGLLYRMIDARLAQQQARMADFQDHLRRLFGDAEEGEAMQILRELRHSLQQRREKPAERLRDGEVRSMLSGETRWERDWKRAFESDR